MKKLILISIAVLTIVGIVYAQSDYVLSLFVRNRLVLQGSSYFQGNALVRGTGTFTTTALGDTTTITGLLATDYVVVSGVYVGGVDQQDVLQVEVAANTLMVHRLASGESAAKYNYIIMR